MWLFDENAWWQWLGEKAISLLLGLALRKIWNRLRGGQGNQGDQGVDRDPDDQPARKPTSGRRDE